jgi:hypothetical protein
MTPSAASADQTDVAGREVENKRSRSIFQPLCRIEEIRTKRGFSPVSLVVHPSNAPNRRGLLAYRADRYPVRGFHPEQAASEKEKTTVALGKELGVYDLKSTSITLVPGKGNVLTTHINFEGTISGEFECEVLATMTIQSADGRDGVYKICARCFMPSGEILDASGEGETTSKGGPRWTVAGIAEFADGRSTGVTGDIDLQHGSFVGKMYERV